MVVLNNLYLIRVINYTLMEISLLTSGGTAIGIIGMVIELPLLQHCMRNRNIMILCSVTGTVQTFAFAVLSWTVLWRGMGIPTDTWMPFLTQIGGLTGAMMMPCLRATIASLGTSGESRYSVAVLLGAIGAVSHPPHALSAARCHL